MQLVGQYPINNYPGLTFRPKWPLSLTIICNIFILLSTMAVLPLFSHIFLQVTHFQNELKFGTAVWLCPLFKIIIKVVKMWAAVMWFSHMPLWSIHIMKLSGSLKFSDDYVCHLLNKGCLACWIHCVVCDVVSRIIIIVLFFCSNFTTFPE